MVSAAVTNVGVVAESLRAPVKGRHWKEAGIPKPGEPRCVHGIRYGKARMPVGVFCVLFLISGSISSSILTWTGGEYSFSQGNLPVSPHHRIPEHMNLLGPKPDDADSAEESHQTEATICGRHCSHLLERDREREEGCL